MNDDLTELELLLAAWEDGTISDTDLKLIQALLKEDAEARRYFLQWQMLTATFDVETCAVPPAKLDPLIEHSGHPTPKVRLNWLGIIATYVLAASILVATLVMWSISTEEIDSNVGTKPIAANGTKSEVVADKENTSHGVAILTRLVNPGWPAGEASRQVGEALRRGRFQLDEGLAQIEFFCGATIVLEGPADIHLESAKHALVRKGKIRATVPPAARGFSLNAAQMKVVDLGTEFAMAVSGDSVSVQVFDGEVELHPQSKIVRRITTGQGISIGETGEVSDAPIQPENFVGISELELLSEQQESQRYLRWRDWSDTIQQDPHLVTFYAFDQLKPWQRRLSSDTRPLNPDLDGAIIGAKVVEGRWPQKNALEFKQPADRVRVDIPGEFTSLTFSCWTRIDSLDRMYNSLFLTDSYDKGEPHWQILDTGQLYFSVRPVERNSKDGPKDYKALSPSFWNPSLQGKWIHLAVTCDWKSRTIIHYLNGQELSRHVVPVEQMPSTAQIGPASIGNWELPTIPDAEFAVRNLNGRIDEFMIFSRSLTFDEVEAIYDQGKP